MFLKLINQPKNLTTLAKSLFINKFLSASPPMDVHSTAFQEGCNTFQKKTYSTEHFLDWIVIFLSFRLSIKNFF